tara:strand:+ start:1354 stop:2322 length:969 start_codon:yes stop_codon:yes gene_type:complete
MNLSLKIKPFNFQLNQSLKTSQGILKEKNGWLIKIESSSGICGWGEVAPLTPSEINQCKYILNLLGSAPPRKTLEEAIKSGPGALGFGIGSALAEIDELYLSGSKKWKLKAPKSAILLPHGNSFLPKLEGLIEESKRRGELLTLKYKVAIKSINVERKIIHQLLERLPLNYRLRLDANSGWTRNEAIYWSNYFMNDSRLEWLEQPLPVDDIEGLFSLSKLVPVALDESLLKYPLLKNQWPSWQVRHPALEGDPRIIIKELNQGMSHISISTTFETGIGRRCINHLAALQQKTLTPTAPGLAPGWAPKGNLFSENPMSVWEAV